MPVFPLDSRISRLAFAGVLALVAIGLSVDRTWAQEVFFKPKNLDEQSLIDALMPAHPGNRSQSLSPGSNRSRNIVVAPGTSPVSNVNPAGGAASVMITFATNSADLTGDSRSALDVIARALTSDKLSRFSFSIEGHADPRGDSDYNLQLSQERAENVVAYLVDQHRIARERLIPIGKGDHELARPDMPTAPENRRVTFKTQIH